MRKRIPGRQIFLMIAPFPPLALFKIWVSAGHTGIGLLAGSVSMFTYCILVIVLARRWDRPTYFDWTVLVYFGLAVAALLLIPGPATVCFERYPVTGIYACLFGAAFFPPLFGKPPFIEHYARKFAPESVWSTPIFRKVNRIMTGVWSAIFGVSTLLSLYPSVLTRAIVPIALILGLGLPFNLRFPGHYLKHLGLPSLAEQKKTMEG